MLWLYSLDCYHFSRNIHSSTFGKKLIIAAATLAAFGMRATISTQLNSSTLKIKTSCPQFITNKLLLFLEVLMKISRLAQRFHTPRALSCTIGGSVKDKRSYSTKHNFCLALSEQRHRLYFLNTDDDRMLFKAVKGHGWETLRAPLWPQKPVPDQGSSSQTGEGAHEERGGRVREQYNTYCYHSGLNRSLNWKASPTPRINWGVLMDSEWINWWL